MLGYRGLLAVQQAAGTLFNTFTTAKRVINDQAAITIPAGYLDVPGKALEIDVWGAISNIATTPGTVVFQVMLGSVIVFTTGTIQLNASAHTTLPFHLKIRLTLDTVGASTTAKFRGQAEISGVMFTSTAAQVDGVNSMTILQAPATAPALGTGFDSTVAAVLDFFAGFSTSNSGNGVQIHQYVVSSDN